LEKNLIKFIDLARTGRHQWWTYLLGLSVILASGTGGSFIGEFVSNAWTKTYFYFQGCGRDAIYYFIGSIIYNLCLEKLAILLSISVVIRVLHRRPFRTLITPHDHISKKFLIQGFGLYFLFRAAAMLVDYAYLYPNMYLGTMLPLSLDAALMMPVGIIISALAEELLFRGYILQGLGLLTQNSILLAIINGLLFMWIHVTSVGWNYTPLLQVFEIGFLFSIITLKSNGLELAIGVHAANNLVIRSFHCNAPCEPVVHWEILFPVIAVIIYVILFGRKPVSHSKSATGPR
jgi:membrane protease YdiL (CAAX protease family)